MRLIVDCADLKTIQRMYEYFPVSGVTTNPTILTRTGRMPREVLMEIREFIGKDADLHVQVMSETADEMVDEAIKIKEVLGANTYSKIPVTREGLKAIKRLSRETGYVTATTIYTPMQAYLAGEAGADYAAPYLNRIDNLGTNGVQVVRDIQDIFRNNNMKTKLLTASFRNTIQVLELAKYGIDSVTVDPAIIEGFIQNDSVDAHLKLFEDTFASTYGAGHTMIE